MERKEWIVFLQLFVGLLNLLLLLISSNGKIRIELKDLASYGVFSDSTSPSCAGKDAPKAAVHVPDGHNPLHNHFQVNINAQRPGTLLMKDKNVHKEFELGSKQLTNKRFSKRISISNDKKGRLLTIGVPMKSSFKQFVDVSHDGKSMAGFSIDIFQASVKLLPYRLIYKMVPYNGSNGDLLKKVAVKNFDAAVGDILIKEEGYQHVEFSQPYMEAGLTMVIKTSTNKSEPWLFISTFTPGMWFTIGAMSLFTGIVIWFIEYNSNKEDGASPARPIGTVFWVSFATLYSTQRETPSNGLTHFVLAPWLFLMLVVTSTFTASLTSTMVNSQFSPSKPDVNVLKSTNAPVGCDGSYFIIQYLDKVLGFKPENIRRIASSTDYAKALSSEDIKAAFLLTPYAKAFLAKYCRGFAVTGPTYKLGGFGFVFQKGSSLALDMSRAILRLSESGELWRMEEDMFSLSNCSTSLYNANVSQSLGPEPFSGLLMISGGASAVALLITLIRLLRRSWDRITNIQATFMSGWLWTWLMIILAENQRRNRIPIIKKLLSTSTRRLTSMRGRVG